MDTTYVNPTGTIDGGAVCYVCGEEILETATDWDFSWGSDGYFPDNASAMYTCWDCRAHWINPPKEKEQKNEYEFYAWSNTNFSCSTVL